MATSAMPKSVGDGVSELRFTIGPDTVSIIAGKAMS